jgi:beta-lactam-binding protein with PASTA domain
MAVSADPSWWGFLKTKDFRKTLLAVAIFFMICAMAAFLWLRLYTHHGQALIMPDLTGLSWADAEKLVKRERFRISIQDSLHILGRPGGEILKQHPAPGSTVKQGRMIYVTTTKYSADKISSSRLPEMYGKSFVRKKRELVDHFEITLREVEKRFDPGEPGQILEVRYQGKVIINADGRSYDTEIAKGDVLEVVVSDKATGKVVVPDLACKTYEEAIFLLENSGLLPGEVDQDADVTDLSSAYIIAQEPAAGETEADLGSVVRLWVRQEKPSRCE